MKQAFSTGFVAATASLWAVFMASASPIPLYSAYREAAGLGYGDLSLTAVAYFCGAVMALLFMGRLSNHLGRRPVTLLALGLAALACLMLLEVHSVVPLVLGRALQGIACGLASSATAAYIVDCAPPSPRWLAATLASSTPMVGLTVGALGSGALIDYGPMPMKMPYLVVLAVLGVCAALTAVSRESVAPRPGMMASLRPQIMLPRSVRRLFPVAAGTFVATWAFGGFYQGFGPALATDQLGSRQALVGALAYASLMAPSAIGGPLAGRLSPAGAQRFGMTVFAFSVGGVLIALNAGSIAGFMIASAFAGVAQGATLSGSIRALLAGASAAERAGVFSVIYVTCYAGAAIPSFIAGQLSHTRSLEQVAVYYGVLAALVCVITLATARDPAHS